jgi:hypothetical protein
MYYSIIVNATPYSAHVEYIALTLRYSHIHKGTDIYEVQEEVFIVIDCVVAYPYYDVALITARLKESLSLASMPTSSEVMFKVSLVS